MLYFLIIIYIIYTIYKISLALLQLNFIKENAKKPAVILSEADYQKAGIVSITNLKFEIFSLAFGLLVAIFWICYGVGALQEFIYAKFGVGSANLEGGASILIQSVFVLAFIILGGVIDLPFEIYATFVKDKKLGFSTITPKIFIADKLKALALTLIFGFLVVFALVFCVQNLGQFWWVYGFGFSFGLILLINLIYPTLIAPLFNKMSPLAEGELKSQIEILLGKCGFKSSGVFVIDAGKRDNRLNAYFGGLGASKKVVLFDTLIKKLSQSEILAVLGHELGHFKHGDILKNIALGAFMLIVIFGVFGNLATKGVFDALNLVRDGGATLIFIMLFLPILQSFLEPVMSKFSRMHEFGADRFGADNASKNDMISALKKLGSENKTFPISHPLYSAIYHSHPSLYERIKELE